MTAIPDAAIEAAAAAMVVESNQFKPASYPDMARAAIAAAMPTIREAIAQEIDRAPIPYGMTLVSTSDFMGGRAHASLVVRGGTP